MGKTCGHTDRREVFIKHTAEMGSDSVIYIPSFTKTGPAIQKFIGKGHRQTA
jgi:hypothetical protein